MQLRRGGAQDDRVRPRLRARRATTSTTRSSSTRRTGARPPRARGDGRRTQRCDARARGGRQPAGRGVSVGARGISRSRATARSASGRRRASEGLQKLRRGDGARTAGVPASALRRSLTDGSQWIDFPGPAGTVPKVYAFCRGARGERSGQRRCAGGSSSSARRPAVLQDPTPSGGLDVTADVGPGDRGRRDRDADERRAAALASARSSNWLLVLSRRSCFRRSPGAACAGRGGLDRRSPCGQSRWSIASQLAFDGGTIILFVPVLVALFVERRRGPC